MFALDPDPADLDPPAGEPAMIDAHDLNPLHVLRLARSLGATLRSVVVVGCEPATLGPPEGQMGLSPPVHAAVERAVILIEELVARFLSGDAARHLATSR